MTSQDAFASVLTDDHVGPEAEGALSVAGDLRAVIGKLSRRLREYSKPEGLTPSQVSVMLRLDRDGPTTVTALARADGERSQSMGATVAELEAAGLLVGAPHPTDRRQTVLSLTPASRELIRDGRSARIDWLFRSIQAHLSPQEQEELACAVRLLERLAV